MVAAVVAARAGMRVTVFEAQDRVGNSIKVTGDGRCNIANAGTCADVYRNADFVARAFDAFSPADALAFLESLGLVLRKEGEGRLYPLTNKATSVIDALRLAAGNAGVEERCSMRVRSLRQVESGGKEPAWRLDIEGGAPLYFDKVVLACGGGFNGKLLPRGLPIHDSKPLLGPLATETEPLRGLDKTRAKCELAANGHIEVGEVTFRSYGLSGIAAFNMTRHVAPGDVVSMKFLPGWTEDEASEFMRQRLARLQAQTWLDFTCGLFLPLVARALLRAVGLRPDDSPNARDLPALTEMALRFPLRVEGIGDKRLCQVHRGGIDVDVLDPATMQIRCHPGLFAAGEMLDVDGPCGGYNLHWAWVSGVIAGAAASGQELSSLHADDSGALRASKREAGGGELDGVAASRGLGAHTRKGRMAC